MKTLEQRVFSQRKALQRLVRALNKEINRITMSDPQSITEAEELHSRLQWVYDIRDYMSDAEKQLTHAQSGCIKIKI